MEFIEIKDNNRVKDAIGRIGKRSSKYRTNSYFVCWPPPTKISWNYQLICIINKRGKCLSNYYYEVFKHFITTLAEQEEITNDFKKYNIISLKVVYLENILVWIITVDDIIDIVEEETTEDIKKYQLLHLAISHVWKQGPLTYGKKEFLGYLS